MVGNFSRFSVCRSSHRRTQSAFDKKEVLAPNSDVVEVNSRTATSATHEIEVATEFKPVEHSVEPLDNDLPIQGPLPEPSILNDGIIWKERLSASMRRRGDLQIVKDETLVESDSSVPKTTPRPSLPNRSILPSLSAPEHNLLNLLEECNAMQTVTSKVQ